MLATSVKNLEQFVPVTTDRFAGKLHLDSTLADLTLFDFEIEVTCPGAELAKALSENPLLPGAILTDSGKFVGTISRRRFLEHLSRPYGLELFSRRPLKALHNFTKIESLTFPSYLPIGMAARQSLGRSPELLYEPIVVEMEPDVYRLLDVHQLLIAQSQIYELTTQMLQEQTRSHTIQTEKMASLGRMVAGIAHEIKNPVNCISGNMGFLGNYCQDLLELVAVYEEEVENHPDKIEQIIEKIDLEFLRQDLPKLVQSLVVSSERLTKIVGGMQNFSHLDETARKPADLHECLDSTLLILNNQIKYDIKLVKNYGDLPLVDCYSGQLSQVFMNLLGNAIDALLERKQKEASHPKGDKTWTPELAIATELVNCEEQSAVIIRIADNGTGIPPQIQQRIFDTFFTTKPVGKGTGLGLAISNEIVRDKHKGQLNLNSAVGRGTEFEIILPLDRKIESELTPEEELSHLE